jgi:hypothetical protein
VGTRITRFVIFHSDWSSLHKDSSASLHWPFLHSFSCQVTDLWRRLIWAFRAGSLVICHCLRSRFFRRISSWILAGRGGCGSARGRPRWPLMWSAFILWLLFIVTVDICWCCGMLFCDAGKLPQMFVTFL